MMTGAFAGRNVGEVFPVVSAVVKLIGEDGKAHAAYAHGALYESNPEQEESLLSVHQSSGAPTTASMTGLVASVRSTGDLVFRWLVSESSNFPFSSTERNVFARSNGLRHQRIGRYHK